MNNKKGFTLIELLVVIAIIGILSSVVLASLNSARQKSRDAKRVSDVKQLQLALELHFDSQGGYPSALDTANLVTPGYIATIPVPPSGAGETAYSYAAIGTGCTTYHLGVTLEDGGHTVLGSDVDYTSLIGELGTSCPDADGTNSDVAAGSEFVGTDPMFDVRP